VAGAVVFDVMGTLFALSPLRERLRAVGAPELALEAWFERLLHSATSLTLTGEFRPFPEIAETALRTTLAQQGIDEDVATNVLERLAELPPYEDAEAALANARSAGLAVATLTNGAESNTRTLLEGAGLAKYVEAVITVEEVRAYKPAPEPYRHAANRLGLEPADVSLVATHGWDVLGAMNAGLHAVWVDRLERRWPFPVPEPRRAPGLVEAVALVADSRGTRNDRGAMAP
jgi:2-haloacid dehalogenase